MADRDMTAGDAPGCTSCGSAEDVVSLDWDRAEALCRECRAPLRFLDFPEDYCDLGEGD